MKKVAILMGGSSKEKKISLKSARTIYKYLNKKKYKPYQVLWIRKNHFEVISKTGNIKINEFDFSFLKDNKKIHFHAIFIMIHGSPGENGKLCSYFEKIKIPYTSCSEEVSILTFNKFKCNNHLNGLGYSVPKSQIFKINSKIDFPCIVKPNSGGSSFGISKVSNQNALEEAVNRAKAHDKKIIIEQFIDGREVTCGVFNLRKEIETLPITEIISENDIFDYDAKYNGKSIEETPAKIKNELKEKIENISKKIYKDLELSGIIRIDFIINRGNPYIIEINTIPGFSEESIIPQMLKCANIKISSFLDWQIKRIL